MTKYSQRDLRWSWKKLGKTKLNLGAYGCLITSLGMLSNKRPDVVNALLTAKGGFNSAGEVKWAEACKLLGLTWKGKSAKPTHTPTILEVRWSGIQHFVIWLGNGQIIDPWDGRQKRNPYRVYMFANVKAPVVKPVVRRPIFRPRYYVVKKGDTFGAIAKRNGMTIAQLAKKNPQIRNVNWIYPKQIIKL